MRAAIYARVSTIDQEPENQLQELRRYVEARGWTAQEYVDHGVSGTRVRRPALDKLRTLTAEDFAATDVKRRATDQWDRFQRGGFRAGHGGASQEGRSETRTGSTPSDEAPQAS